MTEPSIILDLDAALSSSHPKPKRPVTPIEDILKMMESQMPPKKKKAMVEENFQSGFPYGYYYPQQYYTGVVPLMNVMPMGFENMPNVPPGGCILDSVQQEVQDLVQINSNTSAVNDHLAAPREFENQENQFNGPPGGCIFNSVKREVQDSVQIRSNITTSSGDENDPRADVTKPKPKPLGSRNTINEEVISKSPEKSSVQSSESSGVLSRPKRTRVFTQPFSPIKNKKRVKKRSASPIPTKREKGTSPKPAKMPKLTPEVYVHQVDVKPDAQLLQKQPTVEEEAVKKTQEKKWIPYDSATSRAPPVIEQPVTRIPESFPDFILHLDLKNIFPQLDYYDETSMKLEAQRALDKRFESFNRVISGQ